MIEIMHDLKYQNPRRYGATVYTAPMYEVKQDLSDPQYE